MKNDDYTLQNQIFQFKTKMFLFVSGSKRPSHFIFKFLV